jgi:hypothetical protein
MDGFIEADVGVWRPDAPVRGPIDSTRKGTMGLEERRQFAPRIEFHGKFRNPPVVMLSPVAMEVRGERFEYLLRPAHIDETGFTLEVYVEDLDDENSKWYAQIQWIAITPDVFAARKDVQKITANPLKMD